MWWKTVKNTEGVTGMTWKRFEELFLERYFPEAVRDRLRREFANLLQLNMSVAEYEAKFTALSRFSTDTISTERLKCRKFEEGLRVSLRNGVVAFCHENYKALLAAVMKLEDNQEQNTLIKERGNIFRRGSSSVPVPPQSSGAKRTRDDVGSFGGEIGRASCRERVCQYV